MIPSALPIGFTLVAVTAAAAVLARRLRAPSAITLVLVGLGLGFVPGMPRVALRPDLVMTLLMPPLLYSAGVGMSWRGFKTYLRPILLLAVGLVIFTALSVAALVHGLLGMPLAGGLVLGAVISPPDAVAPMAIARRIRVPERILTVLEGEGLVNDATALILFSFAVAAVTQGGGFSPLSAAGGFLAIVGGEIAWGILVGWGSLAIRRWAREPQVEMVVALLAPFAAFWVPDALGGSGVLATVTAGLYVSWNGPRFISPATRLQGFFVWDLVTYLIEGVVFLLTGLQAPVIADHIDRADWRHLVLAALLVSAAVIAVRFVWVFAATWAARLLWPPSRRAPTPWRHVFVVAFTGIRGVVSLAAALSIPLAAQGAPFPGRDTILFITFVVILVTLVGQGFTFGWVVRRLGVDRDGAAEAAEAKRREVKARLAGIETAIARLDMAAEDRAASRGVIEAVRRHLNDRRAYYVAACQDLGGGAASALYPALQLAFLDVERDAIWEQYVKGAIDDEARRRIERELDLDDSRIRHAAASGASRLV